MSSRDYTDEEILANLNGPGALWVPRLTGLVTWATGVADQRQIPRLQFQLLLEAGLIRRDEETLDTTTDIYVGAGR